jgi:hypothetical protein
MLIGEENRKSTTGYCIFVNGNLVSWGTKKQATVALSSTESEYMAVTETAKEVMWLKMLLVELKCVVKKPTIIFVDNTAAISISKNDIHHGRTKHIAIKHHFIKDLVKEKEIDLMWIPTENN